jgi:hypothetical protein
MHQLPGVLPHERPTRASPCLVDKTFRGPQPGRSVPATCSTQSMDKGIHT